MTGVLLTDDSLLGQNLQLLTRVHGSAAHVRVADASSLVPNEQAGLLGGVLRYDDFLSSPEVVSPGAGVQDGLGGVGDTNWQAVFVGAGCSIINPTVALPAGARGVVRLQTNGNGTAAGICRGMLFNALPAYVRAVRRLDFLISLNAQDSGTAGFVHVLGMQTEWDGGTPGYMVVRRDIATQANWRLLRNTQPDIDTGIPAAGEGPWFWRFQQRQDPGTLLGSGTWDLYLGPDLTNAVVAGFNGGGLAGNPAAGTNWGAQVIKQAAPGTQTSMQVDAIGEEFFPQSLADRIS